MLYSFFRKDIFPSSHHRLLFSPVFAWASYAVPVRRDFSFTYEHKCNDRTNSHIPSHQLNYVYIRVCMTKNLCISKDGK